MPGNDLHSLVTYLFLLVYYDICAALKLLRHEDI